MINSPVHDMIIRIKNSQMAMRTQIEWVVFSKLNINILKLLEQYNFISWFEIDEKQNKKSIKIKLKEIKNKYQDIMNVKFFSKPSRRRYISYKNIKQVAWWQGIGIISTSKWIMPTHLAKEQKLGWELIAEIY